ncbi:MAG: tetratricopeptide repeat protein, partial [Candidatus Sulfotelmatobacter sp.]
PLCHTARRVPVMPRDFGPRLRSLRFSLATPSLACILASCMFAQQPSTPEATKVTDQRDLLVNMLSYNTAPGTGVIVLSVFDGSKKTHLDRQALLKLISLKDQSYSWQTTEANAQGVFTNVPYGKYDVEINAVGYLGTHQELRVMDTLRPSMIDVVLLRDSSAINLDVADTVMSPKARKEAKHAIASLKSNNLVEAQKRIDAAYKLAPSSPELNFLLGYLNFQKKDFVQAATYLGTATTLDPRNAQALTLLGRTNLERGDFPAAQAALEKAVTADADNWLPHNLLADTYLRQKNYPKARDEAQVAITKGHAVPKSVAGPAQLVLGEALLGLGQDQDGIQALNAFLEQSPQHPMVPQVRSLIAQITQQISDDARAETQAPELRFKVVDPLAALPAPGLSLKAWMPPGIDDVKPPVATDVACPLEQVLDESGKRVQELVNSVSRFAAVEDLFHQALDNYGIPVRTETRKYNYVAEITEPKPGILSVDEYREDKLDLNGYPDRIASTGLAVMALIFHPDMRDNFEMTCEGLGDRKGQATWLVHFRQRTDKPNNIHSYKIGNQFHAVNLKGRAWITADKFQIVRIETEMISPMPEIQLLSEHHVVEYGPVAFPKKDTTLWLPKSAEIYFDFRKHRYYRRHSFDHYMLYSVDTQEKRKEPGKPTADDKKPT